MGLFKKKKLITLYFLTNNYDKDDRGFPLNMYVYTVAENEMQCEEYLNKMLYIKYKSHYKLWCDCHNQDPKNIESWEQYKGTVLLDEIEEDYLIVQYKYQVLRQYV